MIATHTNIPTDGDLIRAQYEASYWRMRAQRERDGRLETQSRYVLMTIIALCLAGVLVVVAVTAWRAAQ